MRQPALEKPLQAIYDDAFYADEQSSASIASATILVPIIQDIFHARSVQDFGCGIGEWLAVFRQHGATEVLGYDANAVREGLLYLPTDCVRQNCDFSSPAFRPERRSELAISLEVAEHLPASSAAAFVATLTKAAPCICFSAALPHQSGVEHLNERPLSYWRGLFEKHGFLAFDPFRTKIFHDERISWWYRQNIVCFVDALLLKEKQSLLETLAPYIMDGRRSMTVISNYQLERLCYSHLAFNKLFKDVSTLEECSKDELLALCRSAFSEAKLGV